MAFHTIFHQPVESLFKGCHELLFVTTLHISAFLEQLTETLAQPLNLPVFARTEKLHTQCKATSYPVNRRSNHRQVKTLLFIVNHLETVDSPGRRHFGYRIL